VKNLLQILKSTNQNNGIFFINPKEEFLSYAKLYDNSLRLLTYFHTKGLRKESKKIFQLNDNKNFVHSFWASVCGGIIATPTPMGNNDEHRLKLINIYNVLEDAYLIVDSDILEKLEVFAKNNN